MFIDDRCYYSDVEMDMFEIDGDIKQCNELWTLSDAKMVKRILKDC